jgi:hypothetical protein
MRKFIILFISFLFFSSSVMAFKEKNMPENYPLCFSTGMENKSFCPLSGKIGHKLFIVDFTSKWNKAQVDWINGRIFGKAIEDNVAPYHRISYLKMDDTEPNSQKFSYSTCRFKNGKKSKKFPGDEVNKKCEGKGPLLNVYKIWKADFKEVENNFFQTNGKVSEQSQLIEYILNVLKEPKFNFLSDNPERELIIVSDMMQYTNRINLYKFCKTPLVSNKLPNKCKTFDKLIKNKKIKRYFDTRKPENVENLKVSIFFMNHAYQTKCDLEESLEVLWEDIFAYWGITNIKWNYESDNAQSCT